MANFNTNGAGVQQLSDGSLNGTDLSTTHTFSGREQEKEGDTVASATNLTLGDGNYFRITGTTSIVRIVKTGWQSGSVVTLLIPVNCTVSNNSGGDGENGGIELVGALTVVSGSNGATLTLRYNSDTNSWMEISRALLQSQV